MLHKLKQFIGRSKRTASNHLPNQRSRKYLLNTFYYGRFSDTSGAFRGAVGLVRWALAKTYQKKNRLNYKHACLLSGRARGTSQRYSVARTKIKDLSDQGKLFGARKASW